MKMRTSSSSSNPSKSIPSHSFYPHILPFIELAETIKRDLSCDFDVIERAGGLVSLSEFFNSKKFDLKYSVNKESIKF
jgi:hypothetical protein